MVGLCLLGGLVAVPITGEDRSDQATVPASETKVEAGGLAGDGEEGTDVSSTTTASGLAAGGAGRTGVSAATGSTTTPSTLPAASNGGPATTLAPLPPPEDLGPAQEPGPTSPPRAGLYRYRSRANGSDQETSTTVEDKGATDLGTNQVITQKGGGFDATNDVSWRKDGVLVLRSVFTFGQTKGECDWEPDFLQSRLPLAKGVTWQSVSSCMVSGFGPTPIRLERTLDARVDDLRRVKIAGQAVDGWVIESTDRIQVAGRVIEQQGSSLFSSKHGVVVSSTGKATISGPDGSQTSDYSTELLNLSPE